MRHTLPLTLAALLLTGPALAQTRPTATPTRDVAVSYRASGQGAAADIRMSWLPARNLMRMDMPGGQGWMLVDTSAGTGFMVMEAQRMVMDMPRNQMPTPGITPGASARFTREGAARVANLECTNWRVEDQGETARICLTADGVMLKAESLSGQAAGRGALEATSVTYGAQDPARFQRPAGFQAFQMPAGLPPGVGGPNMPRGTALPPPGVTIPGR